MQTKTINTLSGRLLLILALIVTISLFIACATRPLPDTIKLVPPTIVHGSYGKYLCPTMEDNSLTEWAAQGVYFLRQKKGEELTRKEIVDACGGWDFIKNRTSISFNKADELVVYLYKETSHLDYYNDVKELIMGLYPEELDKDKWLYILRTARQF